MTLVKCPKCGNEYDVSVGLKEVGGSLEMYRWSPGSENEETVVPWEFAGWKLEKTDAKNVYVLKLNGVDLLHFHIETKGAVTTPRSTLRKFRVT